MSAGALQRYTETAERAAAEVIDSYSTSFTLATRLLGARHRRHIRNIYALVRVADELVDGVTAEADLDPAQQAAALDRLIDETRSALLTGYSSDLVVHAFASTAHECGIDWPLVDPFFASMRSDLVTAGASVGYDDAAHAEYVHGSAEVVGLMCLRVFTRSSALSPDEVARLDAGASALGAAFQNVNFLRDLADDTGRLGRNYLADAPRLTQADVDRWVATIRGELATAAAVIPALPRDARAAVRAAAYLFAALTDRVEAAGVERLYRSRVRVPGPLKAWLAARAWLRTRLEPGR
ncbi:phytoene/squalene synthase family protein [Tessaracoccus palaemonis]|uniref:Squalene/phytoene synthase family protein n=1 Tax=Tessaracoccus palaemonis TaxID=2829499 RepID=A0ABX8SG83_9ACTN|nr:squalene/phytoene synthase family protein [Tessaracoccus palaemonis]QXT62408.1 squalene/phytoene synthase family protein [Tessaracoccus palaemonis]